MDKPAKAHPWTSRYIGVALFLVFLIGVFYIFTKVFE
jgi:hypothetical protein